MSVQVPVALRIKEYRQLAGMNQAQLAEKVGITRAGISAIEKGKSGAKATTLALIASALDIEVKDLLSKESVLTKSTKTYSVKGDEQAVDEAPVFIELPLITHTEFSSFAQVCQTTSLPTIPLFPITGQDYQDAAILEIRGNSMAPRYPERARFIIRPVDKASWAHAQGVHVVVLNSQLFLLKRITSNQDGMLELSSDAAGEKMKVLLDEVSCLWKVGEGVYYPAED